MRTDKIVWRALVNTLIAIAILFGIMLLVLCFIFPSTMMHITYDLGMDSSSVNNARRAYKNTKEVYYIAYATEVAIGANDYEEVERCGDVFISDDGFVAYCTEKNKTADSEMSYTQYVYGQVCIAKYQRGKKQQSVDKAFEFIGNTFPKNNAVVALLVTAMRKNDVAVVERVETELTALEQVVAESDKPYLTEILTLIQTQK